MRRRQHDTPTIPLAPVMAALGYEIPEVLEGEGWKKTRCVFHPDRTPSASVSYAGYQCFSCERKFDAIKLLMEEEKATFGEALQRAQALSGVEGGTVRRKRRRSSVLLGYQGN